MKHLIMSKLFLFIVSSFIFGCNTEKNDLTQVANKNLTLNSIEATCVDSIKITYPPSDVIAPDELELFIVSTDTVLNQVMENKEIRSFAFQHGIDFSEEESRSGLSIKVTRIRNNYFRMRYMTSHFKDYPIDTVREEANAFLKSTRLIIKSKLGKEWVIKPCS